MKPTLITGLGVAVFALFVVLFSRAGGETPTAIPNNSTQRYLMFSPQTPNNGSQDVYVIDTQTGRVWRQMFFLDGVKGLYMMPQPYLTADQITASATAPESVTLESMSLNKRYQKELEGAAQRNPDKK